MNRRDFFKAGAGSLVAGTACLVPAGCAGWWPRLKAWWRGGEIYAWRGGEGNWANPNNWEPRGVPGPGDDVFVMSGIVTVRGAAPCYSLVIGNAIVRGEGESRVGHLVLQDKPGTCFFWRWS